MIDTVTVTISLNGLDVLALKKLSLVSHALASKFDDYRSSTEQRALATVLDETIRKIELAANGRLS